MNASLEAAIQCHRTGQLPEAERLYRQALTEEPTNAQAAFLLGSIALETSRVDEAIALFRRAIDVDPDNAAYHANLGECYRRLKRPAEAMDEFLRALTLKPGMAEPLFNLGLLMQESGEIDLAICCFECAAQLKPNVRAIEQRLNQAREEEKKRPTTRQGLGPDRNAMSAQLLAGVAATLSGLGRRDAAISLCRAALELDPRCANAHHNLGIEMLERSQMDEAIASLRSAIETDPRHVAAHCNLGNALFKSGLIEEAIASFFRALELERNPGVHSNVLFALPFHPDCEQEAILKEAQTWDRKYAEPLAVAIATHANDRDPDRRLRIGYMSSDFREHCQSLFTVPLLSHHDHAAVEVFCYANVRQPDALTDRLRGYADHWRSIDAVADPDAAALVREDRIDVLIDLTMHMEYSRLGVFARKPAPVQMCWLAYPGTTGLASMDYRITDPHLDPPFLDSGPYSEASIWLPDSFWCYDPLTDGEPTVGPVPALSSGQFTFGCLNNFAKINHAVLDLWTSVLSRVGGSRLFLLAPLGEPRRRALAIFAEHGLDPGRIQFLERRPRKQYLAAYQGIDLCLDTFPSNGHTTSLDALWMGVPVVTLVGKTIVGRAGLCQANNLGLDELVAWTPEEYVRIAVELAGDLDHLRELRGSLRRRMESSALMDGPRFARNMEAAYRQAWRRWCKQLPPGPLMVAEGVEP